MSVRDLREVRGFWQSLLDRGVITQEHFDKTMLKAKERFK